jgi:hypothetical protein
LQEYAVVSGFVGTTIVLGILFLASTNPLVLQKTSLRKVPRRKEEEEKEKEFKEKIKK